MSEPLNNKGLSGDTFEDDGDADWIVTYADMVTLLLVFFVLLFSISSLDLKKFKNAIKAIQVSLGEKNPPVGLLEIVEQPGKMPKKVTLEDITGIHSREVEMLEELNKFIEEEQLSEHIVLLNSHGRIMIRMRGAIIFGSGSAVINQAAKPILDEIVKIINDYPEYSVNIKGHTDNIPISTGEFPSNWELSSIRATNVLKYLIKGGIAPLRLTATGYGALLPIAPNDSEINRAKNRRVEFVLEKRKPAF